MTRTKRTVTKVGKWKLNSVTEAEVITAFHDDYNKRVQIILRFDGEWWNWEMTTNVDSGFTSSAEKTRTKALAEAKNAALQDLKRDDWRVRRFQAAMELLKSTQ